MTVTRGFDSLAEHLYLMGNNLRNRGQNGAGLCINRADGSHKVHNGPGTIEQVFMNRVNLSAAEWHGFAGIIQTRYSTSGVNFSDPRSVEQGQRAAQPYIGNFRGKWFALAYNGNLTPSYVKQLSIELYGRENGEDIFLRGECVDTELIVRAIETSHESRFENAFLGDVCPRLHGAFCFVVLYDGTLYAVRDRHGFRPLEMASYPDGSYAVASENCVFPEETEIRSVEPGECVAFRRDKGHVRMEAKRWAVGQPRFFCQFEQVYFANFTSKMGGERLAVQREHLGGVLARECPPPAHADIIIGVPDSGRDMAAGYAEESRIFYQSEALRRSHSSERTFLEPVSELRRKAAKGKFIPVPERLLGKIVVVVDDSIVRGNVTSYLSYLLKQNGAREVHYRIASPPTRNPCHYGIDTGRNPCELIARGLMHDYEILDAINAATTKDYGSEYAADSLQFISLEGMKSTWPGEKGLCDACWTGNYPVV